MLSGQQETVRRETELLHILINEKTVKKENIINVPEIDLNMPLHLCVKVGKNDIVSYLVSVGSVLNTRNVQVDCPLSLAARCDKNNIVELLLKSEVESDEAKIGALRAVIVAGDVEATSLLL
jgi:ankyrin repeat protein